MADTPKDNFCPGGFYSKNVRELGSQVPNFLHVCWVGDGVLFDLIQLVFLVLLSEMI